MTVLVLLWKNIFDFIFRLRIEIIFFSAFLNVSRVYFFNFKRIAILQKRAYLECLIQEEPQLCNPWERNIKLNSTRFDLDIKMVIGLSLGHMVADARILLIYQKVNAILILYSHGIVFKFPPPRSSSRIVWYPTVSNLALVGESHREEDESCGASAHKDHVTKKSSPRILSPSKISNREI